MQNYKEINGNDYVKNSRTTINETMQSIQSMNSGTVFPTTNLFEGMKCYRTDLKKTYTLTDVENNTWVEDAHAALADEATHAASATKLQTPRALNLSGAVTADAASFDGTADATINVKTLDASKLKGTASVSTTGNAATATKLATARTIALSGNATGSTTFDGSGNATINATVSESAHAATATQVVATAPEGGLDVIHAIMGDNDAARVRVYGDTNNGALEIATGDDGTEPIYARQYVNSNIDKFTTVARTAAILDTNGNTSFPGTVTAPAFSGALNGNAATASKLLTPRTISLTGKAAGSTSFDGSSNASINVTSVNADTASKLSSARKINITGNATGAAAFDGSGDISINTTVNESKHAGTADKATQDTNGRAFTDTNAYMHINALANGTDFNNVKTTGIYYCTQDTYANRPHNSWGILTVYSIGTVKQEYKPDNAAVYYTREYDNSNWTAWSKVAASTADSATTANSLNEISDRPASANVTYNDGKIRYFLATNSMSEAKPPAGDGPIMHLSWDRPGWETQMAIGAPSGQSVGHIQTRVQNNGTWGSWNTILDSENFNRYAPTKTGGGASGSWSINAATATKLQTPRTISLTGNARGSANFDGSENISINTTVSQAANAESIRGESFWSNNNNYLLIGTLTIDQNGGAFGIKIQSGHYFNDGIESYSREVSLYFRASNGSAAKYSAYAEYHRYGSFGMNFFINETSDNTYDIYLGPLMWTGDSICIPILSTACSFDKKYMNVSALPTGAKQVNSYQLVYTDTVNNYAPTKTGSGASGTWPISISGNADTVDGYHASDIINRISAANTGGIIAASLTANGYVKFANGLILQWGNISMNPVDDWVWTNVKFPVAFASTCFSVLCCDELTNDYRDYIEFALKNINTTSVNIVARSDHNGRKLRWLALGV